MKGSLFSTAKVVLAGAFIIALTSGCFKKGEGKGNRKSKPSPTSTGDIFVPGPGAKPGVPKPDLSDPAQPMDPQARAILASCFGIPVEEVEDVPGWTDPTAAVSAANALCQQLANVGYNKGTLNPTAAPVDIK